MNTTNLVTLAVLIFFLCIFLYLNEVFLILLAVFSIGMYSGMLISAKNCIKHIKDIETKERDELLGGMSIKDLQSMIVKKKIISFKNKLRDGK